MSNFPTATDPPAASRKPLAPWLVLALAALAAAAPFLLMQSGDDIIAWGRDVEAALVQAKATGKPVLIDCTADWCPPCRTMKRQVFSKESVKKHVEANFIPLQLDMTHNNATTAALGQRFAIQYLPTFLILSPQGEELQRESGGFGESEFIDWLKKVK